MSLKLAVKDWLDVLDREYLRTFIAEGGATVKVAVGEASDRSRLADAIASLAGERGYFAIRIDAGTYRAHMPQDLFHAIAAEIDWRLLARRRLIALASGLGYNVDGIDSAAPVVPAIAELGGVAEDAVKMELRRGLSEDVLASVRMGRDFRGAMFHLCMAELQADGGFYGCQPILDWLTGENNRIGPLRPFSLRTPINRTTARHFIESTLYWLSATGYSGTVILFDTSRVTLSRNPRDGERYYTRAMAIDHYELLRGFIDDTDRLAATLLIVATSPAFIDDQAPRGWRIYDALRTRVMDDVRDREHANPVAALVRVGEMESFR